jgi:serine/threonine protein kinase
MSESFSNDDGTRAISPQSGAGPKLPTGSSSDVPTRIGRFEVRAVLGEGAFGRVFLAFDAELERQVAIKVPKPEVLTPDLRERFVREARATAKIHHPNVCPVHEVGVEGDLPYLVMHYQAGTTLAAHLDRWKVLPPLHAVALAQKLAQGMAAAHAQNVIHRDLKPQNVLFDPTRQLVLITDFGLARIGTQAIATAAGAVFGTPLYMSPEQARGEVDAVGPLSDVYSLGVILYRMLTGAVPFDGSVYEVLLAHNSTPPVPPSVARRGLDPRLDGLCLKAMAKKPADRYPSAKAFAEALGEYTRSGDSSAWQKVTPSIERKSAAELQPVPAPPAPAAPPIPPKPLELETTEAGRGSVTTPVSPQPPQPPRPPRVPQPKPVQPEPLELDDVDQSEGAVRQKVLLGGVALLLVGVLVVLVVILATSKKQPQPEAVTVPPTDPAPKKDDPAPPVPPGKKDEVVPKADPSIANGFAGHKFDQAAERRTAEWVISLGGELKITPLTGAARFITRKEELPAEFTVTRIELVQKPNLTEADIIDHLSGLTGPIEVSFQECGQVGDDTVRALARIPKLTGVLFFRASRITDASPEALANHPALVEVDFQVTSVTRAGVKRLTTLPQLRRVTLGVPGTDDWLADLAPQTELTHINVLAGPRYLSERGLIHLKPFTKLRRLTMYGRNTTDEWIPRLLEINSFSDLEELSLRESGVEGPGLAHLSKFPRLDWVSLNESRVRDEGVAHLANVPKLGYVFLNSTSVGDDALRSLGKCKNLQLLTLRDNKKITDQGLAHLTACKMLRELDLANTEIGDMGLSELAQCKALKRLVITGTRVTKARVKEFQEKLPNCIVTVDAGK